MSSPLTVLRNWIKNNLDDITIDEEAQVIRCNGETIDFNASSNYVASSSASFSMKSIVPFLTILLNKEELTFAKYVVETNKKGIPKITFKEFKDIKPYLTGETATLPGLKEVIPEPEPEPVPAPAQPKIEPAAPTVSQETHYAPAAQPPQQHIPQPSYVPRPEHISEESLTDKIHQEFQQRIMAAGAAEEVEYELLRPIDSVLTIDSVNFNDMLAEENNMNKPQRKMENTSYATGDVSLIETHTERNFKHPILIVPQTDECAINNSNIVKFLSEGVWEEPNENGPDYQHLKHVHTVKGKNIDFDIVADIKRLTQEDWNHCVAIFLSGKVWQIRDIPPAGDPSQIFKRYTGIYVHFDNQKPNEKVSKWNIKTFQINHANRFLDSQASTKIWQEIETAVSLKKDKK